MCVHVHTHHTFCGHTRCAVYPCSQAPLCVVGDCSGLNIGRESAHAVEHSACQRCLTREGIRLAKAEAIASFGVTDTRAVKCFAQIRRQFSELFGQHDPTLAAIWANGSQEPEWRLISIQEMEYDASQPRLTYIGSDWDLSWLFDPDRSSPASRSSVVDTTGLTDDRVDSHQASNPHQTSNPGVQPYHPAAPITAPAPNPWYGNMPTQELDGLEQFGLPVPGFGDGTLGDIAFEAGAFEDMTAEDWALYGTNLDGMPGEGMASVGGT